MYCGCPPKFQRNLFPVATVAWTFNWKNWNNFFVFLIEGRAKSAGSDLSDADFAWQSSVLVNQDRICHVVKSPTVAARTKEIERISVLCSQTKDNYSFLKNDPGFHSFLQRALYNPRYCHITHQPKPTNEWK
jgi:hypothetical protein